MPMQDWIHKYPHVQALLQGRGEHLLYAPDTDPADDWRPVPGRDPATGCCEACGAPSALALCHACDLQFAYEADH
jgi:hypothetical protein